MKKLLALLICMVVAFSSASVLAADISAVANPVVVNGEEIKFDQGPVLYETVLMLPLRFIAEKIGATVSWHGEMQTVFCALGENVTTLQIGTDKVFVNTDTFELEKAPIIIEGRTLVPAFVIEQITGLTCQWEDGKLHIK